MNLMELFVKIGIDDQASSKVNNITGKIGNGLKTAAKVGTAAVAGITAATGVMTTAFVKSTSKVAEYGDNIDKMSQKMGLSAQAYQEWDFIMQHSGTSMETLKASMKTLANAVDSGNDAFRRLGISQNEIASLNQEELFARTIEELQKVENETERTYLAGQLLGRGATELGALLNTSAEDTEAMRKQVHELGGVMSDEAVKAAAAYQDSLQNMQTAFSGIQRGLLSEFLPSMVTVMDGLALIFSGNDSGVAKVTEGLNDFTNNLMKSMPKIFKAISKIVSGIAKTIIKNLPKVLSSSVEIVLTLINGIIQNAPLIVETALTTILTFANGLVKALPKMVTSIVSIVLKIVDTITKPSTLSQLLEASLAIIIALANGLIKSLPKLLVMAPKIVANLVASIIAAAPKLLTAAAKLIATIVKGIGNTMKSIVSAGARIVNNLWSGISNKLSFITFKGKTIGLRVLSGIRSGIGSVASIGRNIVEGLWRGVSNKIGWVTQKMASFGKRVINSLKNFFGIQSPSTVMRDEIGRFLAEGVAVGFMENNPMAEIETSLNNGIRKIDTPSLGVYGGGGYSGSEVSIIQNIYSQAQTAADLMQEAIYQQEKAVYLGV